jgi:uncharacterized protein with beta-barrel porin domain
LGEFVSSGCPKRQARQNVLLAVAIVAAFAGWNLPRHANAACVVTTGGKVDCKANTISRNSINVNGTDRRSSARQQLFDNGAAITGRVRHGVSLKGGGLQLSEGAATPLPVIMSNQGRVISANAKALNTVQLDGNGGQTRYLGSGSITNTANGGAALFVDNSGGNVSLATGAGAISGATGISASTTGTGALRIRTGSGQVTGTADNAISADTANGPLRVTIGSGGVTTSADTAAINLTSNDGDIFVRAIGKVSGNSDCTTANCISGGVRATSLGAGNIEIGGPGTFSASGGRGILAYQGATGMGGILITGSGSTSSGTTSFGSSSAIHAQISNPADTSNIVIDRSGDASTIDTFTENSRHLSPDVTSAIHAFTAGSGNIWVASGADAALSNTGRFGIGAFGYGAGSTGSINVSTGVLGTLTVNGAGIFANNSATAIPAAADSKIEVTANGTINSGAILNPVGREVQEGGGVNATPAGIIAGYDGGPVFTAGSTAPYTSCGPIGSRAGPGGTRCTTLTPNPNVNGKVSVVNNATINAAGGNGIFAFNFGNGRISVNSSAPINVTGATAQNGIDAFSAERGNISVTASANLTAGSGSGVETSSVGRGKTTINVLGGTTKGAASGVAASSARGAITISNSATIENLSAQPGSLAIATTGAGNATLTNNAGGLINGAIAMAGIRGNSFINTGTWNTLGASTFRDSSVNNTSEVNIFGSTAFDGLGSFVNSGTLNLAVSGAVATLMVPGKLAFQSGALYIVALNGATASQINVGRTATLSGTVEAILLPGAYSKNETYTILQAHGGVEGSFSGFSSPGLSGSLSYSPTGVSLTFTSAHLGVGEGLNGNQQNVAAGINNVFNNGSILTGSFAPLFALGGQGLANALSQLSGEVATGAERGGFQMMTEFLGLMLDPFVGGRLGGGNVGDRALGFAPDQTANLPPEIALAYASVLKSSPATFDQRWTAWGASYGGVNWSSGSTAAGSSNVAAQTYGFAGGMDYHQSPDTTFGFALGGGGTAWGLATGGTGRSDAFQAGVYGLTWSGPAYLAASLALANHWMTTNRSAMGDKLTANFDAQSYGARLEGGYRYAPLPTVGITPYAALQAQAFHTPSYSESDLTGGGLELSYAAMNAIDVRSELGARLDNPQIVAGMPLLLRARVAWAHDWVNNPSLSAAFEALPGSNFVVNGAPLPQNSALTSAGAELFVTPRLALLLKFDGEFAPSSQTYAGSGMLRYTW